MDFPSFGDADGFLQLGRLCASALQGDTTGSCYDGIRGVGAIILYALPQLVSSDKVIVSYLILGMNVLWMLLLIVAMAVIVLEPIRIYIGSRLGKFLTAAALAAVVVVAVILSLPHLPVPLSDLPSLTLFTVGVAFLSSRVMRQRMTPWVIAALFMGASVLVRQGWVVAVGVAIVILWAVCLIRLNRRISTTLTWQRLTVFSAVAAGVFLLQVVWTFAHSGVFWFYEPQMLVGFAPANKQPFIELTAINLPQPGAYLTQVDHPLNPITFFLAKLFYGLSRYDPAVYLGYPQVGTVVPFSTLQAVLTGVIVVAIVALAAIPLVKKQLGLTVLYGAVLVMTFQYTFQYHVENRYLLSLRFIVALAVISGVLWLIPRLLLGVEKLRGRSNDSMNVVPQVRKKGKSNEAIRG
jgi:hypothetical protein